ncbi:hypothetical protein TrVE_jg13558 [Triparma verrucosa]|uniref:Uncharacterized protein n=1 Tax=Triparma verrucosa TaxID=1606542 RepID=A0A9W7KVC5_9STRA|nr:hypothetical protein TrVE_jg13558 [Triparma verrucosa]
MAAREKVGTGRWNYAYHPPKVAKSEQPPIPEPQFRVGPPGVSSGISFRNLPDASLMAIRQICTHYEKKCSGKYSTNSLASRYVFQMSREIMAQLQAMSHNAGGAGQKVRDLESILEEWNDNFGRDATEGFQGVFNIVPMTPTALKNTLVAQRKRVKELEGQLQEVQKKAEVEKEDVINDMEAHVGSARLQAEDDRERQQQVLIDMKRRCEEDVKIAQRQAKEAREEAKRALEFDRKRAEGTVKSEVKKEREAREAAEEELADVKDRLGREYASKLRHLEIKVKAAEDQKRLAVDRATDKLKRIHAAELSSAVREAAMHAGQAAMNQAGGVHPGSSAAASKARVERRDSRMAGGGADILKAEEERVLAPLTGEEISRGKEVETVVLTGEGGGGGGGQGGEEGAGGVQVGGSGAAASGSGIAIVSGQGMGVVAGFDDSAAKLLRLKLKHSTEEAVWLRNRVSDLEVMVKTMKVAMDGSLEEGAGEQEFGGWRQVVSVQYPWLRDRKREDPARYSYLDKKNQTFLKGIGAPNLGGRLD